MSSLCISSMSSQARWCRHTQAMYHRLVYNAYDHHVPACWQWIHTMTGAGGVTCFCSINHSSCNAWRSLIRDWNKNILLLHHVHHLSIWAHDPWHENKNKESVINLFCPDDLIQIKCINKLRWERPSITHTSTHTQAAGQLEDASFQRWHEGMGGCWKTWLCNVRKKVPHRWCGIRKELWPRWCSNNQTCI